MEAHKDNPGEDPRQELDLALVDFLVFLKKQKVNDKKRLDKSGGIYCVVEGCYGKRAVAPKWKSEIDEKTGYPQGWGGYYRDCASHHRGRYPKHKYTEGVWREWDQEKG